MLFTRTIVLRAIPVGGVSFGIRGRVSPKTQRIPKNERGHPILHQFTRAVPSSTCMNCHMHQGNAFVNPYLGYIWWDQETDGEHMYPKVQHDPTPEEMVKSSLKNPEGAAARGLWGDLEFLEKVAELNPKLKHTQFADYHGRRLELSRSVQAGSQRQSTRLKRQHRRSLRLQKSGAFKRHSPRQRNAVHRLPLPCRCSRKRESLRRSSKRGNHRVYRLSRDSFGTTLGKWSTARSRCRLQGPVAIPSQETAARLNPWI